MSIVPVIGRELRSQARQPLTFLLRFAGAAAICLAFWMAFSALRLPESRNVQLSTGSPQVQFQNFGVALFGKMNMAIFVVIWLLTPLAAADSISRERREGTLPLLQLTRLRPWEIVLGKSFVHMARASTLFLTMLPWLLIPFLFGGLSLQDFGMALLIDLSALFLAQAAGLLASTLSRDWLKAVIWAEAIAFALLLGMMGVYEHILENAFTKGTGPAPTGRFGTWTPPRRYWAYNSPYRSPSGFVQKGSIVLGLLTNGSMEHNFQQRWIWGGNMTVQLQFQSVWQRMWADLTPRGESLWFRGVAGLLAGSAMVFVIAIIIGADYVRRTWRESERNATGEKLRKKFFTPKYGVGRLRKGLSRSLSRNPIGWLHHYSPSARLTKWAWCLFLIGVEIVLAGNVNDIYSAQAGLGYLLLLGLLFSSTGSFREELESGAFELLLVTPLREGQILLGRVGGIWQQFLPAFLIYGAGAIFLGSGWNDNKTARIAIESIQWFGFLYLLAPFVGLYFSLVRWNFLVAWVCAALVAIVLPIALRSYGRVSKMDVMLIQVAVCVFLAWRIRRRLGNRVALGQVARETA